MTLMAFTERSHIIPIRAHKKEQTTRPRRKIPIRVGAVLQCYFTPRMRKNTCYNCISAICPIRPSSGLYIESAENRVLYKNQQCLFNSWTNFFGEAIVTEIDHCWNTEHWLEDQENERYLLKFCDLIEEEPQFVEEWAIKDGFPQGFKQANEWFTRKYGVDWAKAELDIIYFEPLWELRA